MVRKNATIWALGGVFLCGITLFLAMRLGSADADNGAVDWFNQTPAVTKNLDITSADYAKASNCVPATLQVARGLSKIFETHCYVSTAAGMVDYEGQYIRPPGYDVVYPVNPNFSGVLIPIPTQAGVLWLRGATNGSGVNLGYFRNFYGNMSYNSFYNRFDFNAQPDFYFRYGDGQAMQFDYGSLANDPNGRYMLIDTLFNGFVVIDTLNLGIQPVLTSFPAGTSGVEATAISGDGKVAVVSLIQGGDGTYDIFKFVDKTSCTGGLNQDSHIKPTFQCRTINLAPNIRQAIPNLAGITNMRFANERTITFTAKYGTATSGYRYGRFSMTAGGQPASLKQYEAIGDSYISGEGAFSYRTGTDTDRNKCHQSTVSYPYLLSNHFGSFASVACSGARLQNIVTDSKVELIDQLIGNDPTLAEINEANLTRIPGVLSQAHFINEDNPEAVTVSVGGNDVGFADIIQKCVNPLQNLKDTVATHSTCYSTYEDRLEVVNLINSQFTRLRSLYETLKQSSAGDRRVYVIGYPQVMKVGGDCGANVAMNADEVAFAHDLIDYLDGVIKRASDEAGVQYVDTQAAFNGHRLCEAPGNQIAVNGITIAKDPDGNVDPKGSYHPNALGHQLLASAIAVQTNNLTKPMPTAVSKTNQIVADSNTAILQNVPHTNRVVRYIKPYLELVPKVIQRGVTYNFSVNPKDFFTKANSIYNFVINSDPVNLGNFTSDADGVVHISASIPASVPPGFHTLHIYGSDIFGNPIDMQQVVFVAASDSDYDNDGVPNNTDSCVIVAQSGVDVDADGIDDACDPQVVSSSSVDVNMPPDDVVWADNSILTISIFTPQQQMVSGP